MKSTDALTTSDLERKASDLLNACAKSANWSPAYDLPAVRGFLQGASRSNAFRGKWHYDDAVQVLYVLLEEFQREHANVQPPFLPSVSASFWRKFRARLKSGTRDYWLITPIHRLELTSEIQFGNYVLLPDFYSGAKKVEFLSKWCSLPKSEIWRRIRHTRKTKSSSFLEYAWLCRRVRHLGSWVEQNAGQLVALDIAIIRALARVFQTKEPGPFVSVSKANRKENRFIAIHAAPLHDWTHRPLWSDKESTTIPGDLDWLRQGDIQRRFIAIERAVGYMVPVDRLALRCRRALIYHSRAVDAQKIAEHRIHEGNGLEVLYLMIAAESLLLDREAEKRLRLASFISRLSRIPGLTVQNVFDSIDACYNLRSDFVHTGEDVFAEFDSKYEESVVRKHLANVRRALAGLMVRIPEHLRTATKGVRVSKQAAAEGDRAREREWFRYLEKRWRTILSGSRSRA